MNCAKCGSYYPHWEKSCPYCNHVMSKAERAEHDIAEEKTWDGARAVAAELFSVEEKKSFSEALGRGLWGEWLFGTAGALAGVATTPTRAKRATFRVTYANGRTGWETVKVGSERYKELNLIIYRMSRGLDNG